MTARLDHLVLNTHYDIDAAAALLQALGFTLPGGYLELIGQPRHSDKVRQEILDSPLGLDGLVYAVDDVPACHDAWQALGLQVLAHSEIPETHTIRIGPILKGAA